MIRKTTEKFSSLLLKIHRYVNRHIVQKNKVPPRILNYKTEQSQRKVFHFNANFVIGGTSQLIADIIEKTSDKYFHHVIVPDYPRPLPYQPLSISEFSVSELPALYKYLEKEKPELVHIHYWIRPMHRFYSFGLWYKTIFKMCEELKLKVIQNINVPTHPFESSSVIHNVFVSQFVKDQFCIDKTIESSVIHPGSDLSHFTCPDDYPFPTNTIGMVYRLDADKLNEETIEIFITSVKKKPDLFCYIIGDGYYFNYYKKRVKEEGQEKNFLFTGFISYDLLPEYYKKIGLIVAPVHDESFGQVTPFAMSMGLPVVGYDTGALSEILGGKEMLVKYGDVAALTNLIVETVNNPAKKKKWAQENKKRVQSFFSLEKMVDEYEILYKRYIA